MKSLRDFIAILRYRSDTTVRLVRRGIRFSKSLDMHNTVMDLLVYFYNNEL